MFRRLLNFARSLIQRAVRVLKRVEVQAASLEPEEVEAVVRTVVRIALTYRVVIVRFVEIFLDAVITTIKENQWEPQH